MYLDNKRSECAERVREEGGALVAGETVEQHLQHPTHHVVLTIDQRRGLGRGQEAKFEWNSKPVWDSKSAQKNTHTHTSHTQDT